jgi:hypothetical protein
MLRRLSRAQAIEVIANARSEFQIAKKWQLL